MRSNYFSAIPVVAALVMTLSANAEETSAARPMHWYRGNTHTHTRFSDKSDANGPPAAVVEWYKAHGYQFLFVTDHEHLTDVASLNERYGERDKFLVLPGQEITQIIADPNHTGGVRHAHVNGLDINRTIMPLLPPERSDVTGIMRLAATGVSMTATYQRNLTEIVKAGGFPQINHPNLLWSVELKDLMPLQAPFLFEIWNGYPNSNNLGGTDEQGHVSPSAESLWDSLLGAHKVVWGVGSDDSHTYDQFDNPQSPSPGKAWVEVCAPALTIADVMNALRHGNFYASTGVRLLSYKATSKEISIEFERLPDWSPNLIPVTRYTTRFIGSGGRVLAEIAGPSPHYSFQGNEGYVRASITDSDGRRAWTQPVFLDARRDESQLRAQCVNNN